MKARLLITFILSTFLHLWSYQIVLTQIQIYFKTGEVPYCFVLFLELVNTTTVTCLQQDTICNQSSKNGCVNTMLTVC